MPPEKPTNIPAIVALVAGIVALPTFVFDVTIVAWIAAFTALVAGILGVKRALRGARGMVLAWVGIGLGSIALITLMGMLVLLVTRPLRY